MRSREGSTLGLGLDEVQLVRQERSPPGPGARLRYRDHSLSPDITDPQVRVALDDGLAEVAGRLGTRDIHRAFAGCPQAIGDRAPAGARTRGQRQNHQAGAGQRRGSHRLHVASPLVQNG